MADASFLQTSFLGGEWSPLVQGNAIDPNYKRAMNKCRNGLPIEEGGATRRPGFRLVSAMRKGAQGVYRAFHFEENAPYLLELTAGHLRFVSGAALVTESTAHIVDNISTANPAVFETLDAHGYTTGDEILCTAEADATTNYSLIPILGRELEVTVVDTTHFSVKDAVTGASIDGSTITLGESVVSTHRIFDLTTSYASTELDAIRVVQDQSDAILLHGSHLPLVIANTSPPNGSTYAIFTVSNATLLDGPYLDPVSDGTTVTLSAKSGSVTATLSGGATRFASTDVGRSVRFFSEPAAWAIGTSYNVGDQVTYNGEYFQALKANTGKQPDVDIVNWGVATGAAVWNWGTITAYSSATVATVSLQGDAALTSTSISSGNWRLGVYSDTTGYPTCGVFHEGRLWLAGAVGNRVDASKSNDVFNFAPTADDGTVADDNGISAIFNSTEVNQILWMISDEQGIYAGTQHGEWRIRASSNNDALTPTSIQAKEITTFGSANAQAYRATMSLVFVQRYNKKVLEFITTDFRGPAGKNISLNGKHLTQKGVVEIAYQKEKVPVLWARTTDGTLLSCTFKRESPWASDPPDFNGWAAHALGDSLTLTSIQTGPSFDGTMDALSIVVKRASDGLYYGLQLTDFFDVNYGLPDAIFVDFASAPVDTQLITGSPNVLRFYGLWRLAGETVSAMVGGVDAGDFTVSADGHFDVPLDQTGSLLTTALVEGGFTSQVSFNGLALSIQTQAPGTVTIPAGTGVLAFDTSLGGDGNGVAIPDWDGAMGYGKPVLFTSSASTGACAVWDLTANTDPPSRLAYHATNASQGTSVGSLDSKGNIYLGNFSGITKIDKTLQVQSTTTISAHSWNNWINVQIGGLDYLVGAQGTQVDLIDVHGTTPTVTHTLTGAVTEPAAGYLGRIRVTGTSVAELWLIGQPQSSGGAFTRQGQNLGLYKVFLTALTVTSKRIMDITPAMFGWTHFTANVDILGDETDGNPIIWAQSNVLGAWSSATTYNQYDCVYDSTTGHDYESLQGSNTNNAPAIGGTTFWRDLGVHQAVAEQNFIKVDVASGAVMWTVKMIAGLDGYRQMSRVRYGKLRVLDPSAVSNSNHYLWDIDTLAATGTLANTALVWDASPDFAKQFYNDKTGTWIAGGSYGTLVGQANTLTPIGGSPTSFTGWFELGPSSGWSYPLVPAPNAAVYATVPAAIGYTYESDFQILRAILPPEAGSPNGPALGKTRRTHHYSMLFQQAQGVSVGTDFVTMHAVAFASPGGTPYAKNALFSGVAWEAIEAIYDFDNMIAWKITRPYPCTVCAVEGFLHTQDR